MKQRVLILCVIILFSNRVLSQGGTPGNNSSFGGFLGWNAGVSAPLTIMNGWSDNMNFLTGLGGIQRMVIRGLPGPTQGFVGIGTGFTTPQWQLDVNNNTNLNINFAPLANTQFGYRINGQKILSNPNTGINTHQNIFVGVNAGSVWNTGVNSYSHCTFVGENAGVVNTRSWNTFLGTNAGVVNTIGEFNTLVGDESGMFNTTGFQNTFIGHHSGINNTTGALNTYIGEHTAGNTPNTSSGSFNTAVGGSALGNISTGSRNSAVGVGAGASLTTGNENCIFGYFQSSSIVGGSRNVYIGSEGGGFPGPGGFLNANGNDNVHVGFRAGYGVPNQSERNIFIGAWTGVLAPGSFTNLIVLGGGTNAGVTAAARGMASNNMILGNNLVRVGIGMSAVVGGPQNKLELNCDIPTTAPFNNLSPFNPAIPGSWPGGGTGASGLRFRDLTSLSVPVPTAAYTAATINPTHVLTVDGNGDIVKIVPTASVQTNNGISTTSLGVVQLGINCPETNTAIVSQFQLINDRQLPTNNFNFCFNNPIPPNTPFGPGGNRIGIGTNNCTPGNRLEVDRNTGLASTSGLRLSQFAVGAPTVAAFQNRMLSVDANGDVILSSVPTPTGGGTAIGNYCVPGPPNPLIGSDYEIPTGGFNYRFTGQSVINQAPGAQQDVVSVGYNCGVPYPVAKFNVLEQQTIPNIGFDNYAGYFINNNIGVSTGTTPILTSGVYGEAKGSSVPSVTPAINAGGVFEGYGSIANIGVIGRITKSAFPMLPIAASGYAIGGAFISDTTITNINGIPAVNYGVYARANSAGSNIAVYAEALPVSGGTVGPNFAGYFNGDVVKTGSDNFTSDQNLKQSINSLTNGLSIVNQLSPKTFSYQTNTYPQMGLPSGLQYGLIAQDVQTVLPAIVNSAVHPAMNYNGQTYNSQSYLTLEYQQLIPILIKAVQELSQQNQQIIQQNQSQDSLIQVLTQNINACCENQQAKQTGINGNGKNAQQQVLNQMNIDLSDKDVIVLNQNIPNPYAEHTTITYNVPVQFKYAQMIFKTIDGRIIKTTDLEKGKGQLNVFASDLSNGLYMYTLIVDGKEFDTKKMVKQN